MPAPADDRYYGGKPGSARKAFDAMVKQYGPAEGERIYKALLQKRRAAGKRAGLAAALARRSGKR